MEKLMFIVAGWFFSKEKVLLMRLLHYIQKDVNPKTGEMRAGGMCIYIYSMCFNKKIFTVEEYRILDKLIKDNKLPLTERYNPIYFFEPYLYEPRYQYLKRLIKKY